MRPTLLIFIKAFYRDGSLVHVAGDEVPPNMFAQETIARAIDSGDLRECDASERRSLFRLLPRFSGTAADDHEQLTPHEKQEP